MNNSRMPGQVVSLVGAVLVILAYYALPVVIVPFVGSITAPTLAGLAPEAHSLALMPLVPIAAIVGIGVSVWMLAKAAPRTRRIGAIVLIVVAALTALAYLVPLVRLQGELSESGVSSELGVSATTFTGIGFWAGLIGAILVGVGGILELTTARSRALGRV